MSFSFFFFKFFRPPSNSYFPKCIPHCIALVNARYRGFPPCAHGFPPSLLRRLRLPPLHDSREPCAPFPPHALHSFSPRSPSARFQHRYMHTPTCAFCNRSRRSRSKKIDLNLDTIKDTEDARRSICAPNYAASASRAHSRRTTPRKKFADVFFLS